MTFAFAHLESSLLPWKEESRQTYFKLGFYHKATREEDKHSPKGPFHFLSSVNPVDGSKLARQEGERKEYSTVTQKSKILNVVNLFLESYK